MSITLQRLKASRYNGYGVADDNDYTTVSINHSLEAALREFENIYYADNAPLKDHKARLVKIVDGVINSTIARTI